MPNLRWNRVRDPFHGVGCSPCQGGWKRSTWRCHESRVIATRNEVNNAASSVQASSRARRMAQQRQERRRTQCADGVRSQRRWCTATPPKNGRSVRSKFVFRSYMLSSLDQNSARSNSFHPFIEPRPVYWNLSLKIIYCIRWGWFQF